MCVVDTDATKELALRRRAEVAESSKERDRLIRAADLMERRRRNKQRIAEMESPPTTAPPDQWPYGHGRQK